MNTNFNILIGADTSKLTGDISSVMRNIGSMYPIQVEAVLSNEAEIHGQIERIAKKLKALGNVNVGFGGDNALGSLDKDLSKASSEAQKIAKNMEHAFDGMSKEVKSATKDAQNLLKVTEKINAESNKTVKATTVKGNDFFTEKTTSTINPEDDEGKLTPDSIEKTFDYKKLSKYIDSVNDDLSKWGHTVDLSGEKIEQIKRLISTIDSQYKFDPQGAFVKDLKAIEELHSELTKVSAIIDKQTKESARHLEKIKKADLSMLDPHDVARLENDGTDLYNQSNLYKDKDYWTDGEDDKFFENLEYQKQKLEESLKLNKALKQKQSEIDKTSKAISANIEKWKDNGLLANSEVKKMEESLSGLSRHSQSFEDDLKAIQRQANELSVKEQSIIQKQKDDEQARLKIQQAQIDYQIKINKLKEEGYYNHLQLKTLEKSFDKLHDGQEKDLVQVNKLLDELNTKYAKAVGYADDVKKKSRLNEAVRGSRSKLENIDQDLMTTPQARKDYKSFEGHIEKLQSPDITKKAEENSLKRINELYARLLKHQKESIANQKLEVKQAKEMEQVYASLEKIEQKTNDEQNKLNRERIEQQQRAKTEAENLKKTQAKEMEQVYASLARIDQKHIDEENARRRMLAEQQERDHKNRIKQSNDEKELARQMAEGREKAQSKRVSEESNKTMSEAEKEARKHNAELERQYHNQERINQEVKEFEALKRKLSQSEMFDPSDFEQVDRLINSISKDSKTLEKDLKAVYSELNKVGEMHNQIGKERAQIQAHLSGMEQRNAQEEARRINDTLEARARATQEQIDQMARVREQSEERRRQEERTLGNNQNRAIESEQQRQYQNQVRITEASRELDEELREIASRDLFDDADLARARQMISQLSKESNTLESDLRAIRDELKGVNKEINSRQQRQTSINNTVNTHNNNANRLEANNILPQDLIQNFRSLTNSLSLDSFESEVESVANEFRRLVALEQELSSEIRESERYERLLVEARQQMVRTVDMHGDRLEQINYNLRQQLSNTQNIEQVQGMINSLTAQLAGIKRNNTRLTEDENRAIRQQIQQIQRTTTELRGVEREMSQIERQTQTITEKLESMRYRATRGFNNSTRQLRQITQEFDEIESRRQQLLAIDTTSDEGRNRYREEYAEIERMMNNANRNSANLRDEVNRQQNSIMGRISHAFKQVPIWMSAMGLFYGLTTQIQQGFQSMLDIDQAMINLSKVTDATNLELERFRENASAIGNELGVLTADVINSTAEFQKLGYSLSQSTALATNTLLYANVGDMNIDDATSYMVSSIKGFNIEVDKSGKEVQKVIDIFNAVSNNYAISAEGIGQALQRSSAVLTQAGNSIEQSVALITSANTTIQDPMKVGNALKTISMRLRGVDEEGKNIVTLVPELEATFNRFGATIMENEDTFKSTYDIMDELKRNWHKLTDIEQANITELIGGKEQGSIVASMIANWGDALGSYETALSSAGSAQREFEKYTEGFAYKINSLKVALEEMWTTMMDDDAFKSAIDSLTSLVHAITWTIDRVGAIPLIMGTATLALTLFSKTIRKNVLDTATLSASFVDLTTSMRRGQRTVGGVTSAFGTFAKSIGKTIGKLALITGVIMGVSWAIGKIVDKFREDEIAREERIKTIDDEIMKYEELKSSLADFDMGKFEQLNVGFENNTLNDEEMKEYLSLRDIIVDEMPELIQSYDENDRAVLKSADAIKELIDAKDDLYAKNLREKAELAIEDMDTKSLEKQIDEVERLTNQLHYSNEEEEVYNFVQNWIEENEEALENGGEELKGKLGKFYSDASEILSSDNMYKGDVTSKLSQFQFDFDSGNVDGVIKYLDEAKKNIKLRSANLATEVENSKGNLRNEMNEFTMAMDDMINSALLDMDIDKTSNEYLFVQEMRESIIENIYTLEKDHELEEIINLIPTWIEHMLAEAEKADVSIDELFDFSLEGDALTGNFDKFIKSLDMGGAEGNVMIAMLQRLRNEAVKTSTTIEANPIEPFQTMQNSVIPAMDEYYNKIQDLDDAYRRLAEGERLSNSEVLNLVKNHPQLNKSLTTQNGYLHLNKEALKAVSNEHQNSLKVQMASARQSVETARNRALANIQAISSEIKAEELLSRTRQQVVQQALIAREKEKGYMSYGEAVHVGTQLEREYDNYVNLTNELNEIDALMNSLGKVSLGNITSGYSPSSGSSGSKGQKQELQDAIYVADKYKLKMDELNASIEKHQKQRANMHNGSYEYRTSLSKEISLTKEKSKAINAEIASIEKQIKTKTIQEKGLIQLGNKDDNKTARAKSAELSQKIDELKGQLNQLRSEAEDVKNTAIALNMDYMEVWTNLYALEREALTDDIAYQEYIMSMHDQNSKAYKNGALEKIRLLKVQEKYWQKELDYLENQKKMSENFSDSQILELNQKIRDARENLYSINKDIIDEDKSIKQIEIDFNISAFEDGMDKFDENIKKSEKALKNLDDDDYVGMAKIQDDITATYRGQAKYVKDVIKELEAMKIANSGNFELVNSINDEIKKWKDSLDDTNDSIDDSMLDLKNIFKDLADEVVEMHKEGIQMQIDAEEDLFEEVMSNYEKAHDTKMEQYEEELEILSDIYDTQIEMINREDATRTYDNTLSKLRKEADKLQKQIDLLSLDNSFDSVSKRQDLKEELDAKNEEIDELQYQREKDLRIESLEDAKEIETDKLENQKDIYEDEYQELVRLKEKEHQLTISSLEERLNDERYYSQLRKDIMDGEFAEITSMMETFTSNMDYYSKTIGTSLTQNIIDKLKKASESIKGLGSIGQSGSGKTNNITTTTGALKEKGDSVVQKTNTGGLGSSSGNKATADKSKEVKYSTPKVVKAKWDCWLFSTTTKDEAYKMKKLPKGSQWKAHGENGVFYSLGSGYSEKGNFEVVADKPSGSSSGSSSGGSSGGSSNSGGSSQSQRYYTVQKGDTMSHLAQKYYGKSSEWKKIQNANPSVNPNKMQIGTKLLIPFRTGGYTGDWSGDDGRLAVLHKKEQVLNADQTQDLFKTIEKLEQIKRMNVQSPNIKLDNEKPVQQITNEYNITLEIENMNGDKKSADIVSEQILQNMKRTKGGRFY